MLTQQPRPSFLLADLKLVLVNIVRELFVSPPPLDGHMCDELKDCGSWCEVGRLLTITLATLHEKRACEAKEDSSLPLFSGIDSTFGLSHLNFGSERMDCWRRRSGRWRDVGKRIWRGWQRSVNVVLSRHWPNWNLGAASRCAERQLPNCSRPSDSPLGSLSTRPPHSRC
jgi:hypothetical protein